MTGESRLSAVGLLVAALIVVGSPPIAVCGTVPWPGAQLVLKEPRHGEAVRAGGTVRVSWTSRGVPLTSPVTLQVAAGLGAAWEDVGSARIADGAMVWQPGPVSGMARLRLADPTGQPWTPPVSVLIKATPTTVAPTGFNCLGVMSDGSLRYWGRQPGDFGEEGVDGNPYFTARPVQVFPWLDDVVDVSSGFDHSVLVRSDGTVWLFGSGHGYGDGGPIRVPTQVPEVGSARWVSAGISNTFVMDVQNRAWGFGGNGWGSLGDGTIDPRSVPVRIPSLDGCVAIEAGDLHSLALREDGTVLAWGLNVKGQLGDGTTISRSDPAMVQGLTDVVAIAAQGQFSIALKTDGTVWTWGSNEGGQLGNGGVGDFVAAPEPVDGLSGIEAVASGRHSGYALDAEGRLFAWGLNGSGQLGLGTREARSSPVPVPGTRFRALWAGYATVHAVTRAGRWVAWGSNYFDQVGDGTGRDRTRARRVRDR